MRENLDKKELATEEEPGACAHCRMQGELAVQCVGYGGAWMQHILGSQGAHCADLILGVKCGSRLSPPLQSPRYANGSVLKAEPVSTNVHGDALVVSYLGVGGALINS